MTRRVVLTRRSAFTLIELLVVIAILAILMSLTAAAVFKFSGRGTEAQAQNDILRLAEATGAFKQEFPNVDYIPSIFVLRERHDQTSIATVGPLEKASLNYLSRMFGSRFNPYGPHDWTGKGVPAGTGPTTPIILEGTECLVFFLGGIPGPDNQHVTGFSSSPTNPTAPGGSRRGPFFDFKSTRLKPGAANYGGSQGRMLVYIDPFENDVPQPYAYFSSAKGGYNQWSGVYQGSDCKALGIQPYYQSVSGTAPNQTIRYYNHDGIQIICAGADGKFGPGGLLAPGASASDADSKDNFTNFSRLKLGAENRD